VTGNTRTAPTPAALQVLERQPSIDEGKPPRLLSTGWGTT
jgi:hypothetical protein